MGLSRLRSSEENSRCGKVNGGHREVMAQICESWYFDGGERNVWNWAEVTGLGEL